MSIWGNAITLGGSGGGGGPSASDAILTATVPTGSTVTAVKGGVTLTPTMWVQAADNTFDCALFVISPSLFDAQNAWTVTASLSGDTAIDTVTIDSNKRYDLELNYRTYLFKSGEGALVEFFTRLNAGAIINIGTESITAGGTGACCLFTSNAIAASDFSDFGIDAAITWTGSDGLADWAGGASVKTSLSGDPVKPTDYSAARTLFNNDGVRRTYSISLDALNQSYYFGFSGNVGGKIYNIWLH